MDEDKAWVEYQLSSLLGFDGIEEMATYLLQMPAGNKSEENDVKLYAKELLGEGQAVDTFIVELIRRKNKDGMMESKGNGESSGQKNNALQGRDSGKKGAKMSELYKKESDEGKEGGKGGKKARGSRHSQAPEEIEENFFTAGKGGPRGKNVGVKCSCLGTVHKPVGNCTRCGKIICEIEGWYTCSFCSSNLERVGYKSQHCTGSKEAAPSERTSVGYGKTIEDAVSLRDRLLLFDRTSAERTRVYDDQADYYNSYEWLTDQEKQKAIEKEEARREALHARKRDIVVTFDIAGRKLVVENEGIEGDGGQDRVAQETCVIEGSFEEGRAKGGARTAWRSFENKQRMYANDTLSGKAKQIYDALSDHFTGLRNIKMETEGTGTESTSFRTSGRVQYENEDDFSVDGDEGNLIEGEDLANRRLADTDKD